MRTVRRLGLAAIVLAGRGLTTEAAAASPSAVPVLEVTSPPPRSTAPERAGSKAVTSRAKGAALALNSLSEARQRELAAALDRVAAALVARRHPLVVPLDEVDPRAEVKGLLVDVAPCFGAAEALAEGRWTSAEGDVIVRWVGRCAAGAACFPLTAAGPRGEPESRARFLAWPVGFAILLQARDLGDAVRLATTLREAPAKGSRIALVLSHADLHAVRASPALTALRHSARRVLRAGGDRDEAMARLLGSIVDARAGDVSWLSLPPEVVLIVPRLDSLATADAFVEEVGGVVGGSGGDVGWLSSPRPR